MFYSSEPLDFWEALYGTGIQKISCRYHTAASAKGFTWIINDLPFSSFSVFSCSNPHWLKNNIHSLRSMGTAANIALCLAPSNLLICSMITLACPFFLQPDQSAPFQATAFRWKAPTRDDS